ncbi:PREDICTED: uncharacterized protein LOC108684999 [Atta colombica]|uniref:uncharacterized protein LOC108684999 n=1 Tax=Atta colombica TaxID=520822 RepID=UPI00084BF46C|nr:PREDICTED: uncharacterized protein LOC108684999 [Atta colombica]
MGSPGRPHYPQPINIKRLADECPLRMLSCATVLRREATRASVLAAYRDNSGTFTLDIARVKPFRQVVNGDEIVVCACVINARLVLIVGETQHE